MNASKTIHLIAAARPNFMKIAPLYHALVKEDWAEPVIVHTGQYYDINMSDAFFRDLGLPEPYIYLNVGSDKHSEYTGRVFIDYEKVLNFRSAIPEGQENREGFHYRHLLIVLLAA